jgi:hypothetical protein
MEPSAAHEDQVAERRRYEAAQARIDAVHALARERRAAREAQASRDAVPMVPSVDARVHSDGYFTRF